MSVRAESASAPTGPAGRVLRGLPDALTFLTILPLPGGHSRRAGFSLGAALPWFPVVGALVGAIAGGLRVAFEPLLGGGPSTVVAMVGLVVVTGALHQDAFADTADGLGARGDAERRLHVMRDSRLGAFGVLALIAWALLLFTSLEQLSSNHVLFALIGACVAGRFAGPLHGLLAPGARADGLGARLHVSVASAVTTAVVAAVILAAALGPLHGGVSFGIAVVVAASTALLARRTLGGSTGDTLGAAIALTEVCVCVALAGLWR